MFVLLISIGFRRTIFLLIIRRTTVKRKGNDGRTISIDFIQWSSTVYCHLLNCMLRKNKNNMFWMNLLKKETGEREHGTFFPGVLKNDPSLSDLSIRKTCSASFFSNQDNEDVPRVVSLHSVFRAQRLHFLVKDRQVLSLILFFFLFSLFHFSGSIFDLQWSN